MASNAENVSIWWRHHVLYANFHVSMGELTARHVPLQLMDHHNDMLITEMGSSQEINDTQTCFNQPFGELQ